MSKINDFINRFRADSPDKNILHNEYGNFNLSKSSDKKRLAQVVVDLWRETSALTKKDIKSWRQAWQRAINVDYPDRRALLDIYVDTDADDHLTGCVQQRKGFVTSQSFKIIDKSGKENEDVKLYFDTEWFGDLIDYILDSKYWGHSLIELGDVFTNAEGLLAFDGVTLIDRKHVIPEYHVFTQYQFEDHASGFDYHGDPYKDWLIEAGKPFDLGLYLKAAPNAISKRNVTAFWDQFAEIFGMPMRIAHTTSRDEKDLNNIEKMMQSMGTAFYGLFPEGTDVEMKENSKTDSYNVYDKRIDRCDSEISKLIIGQTMTIENGSSKSQSETHLKILENLVRGDRKLVRNVINNQLLPRMVKFGFPIDGCKFEWDDSTDYTPEQQLNYEKTIASLYEVDPKYFADKYGMPVGKAKQQSTSVIVQDD
jgi:hypothetical protein